MKEQGSGKFFGLMDPAIFRLATLNLKQTCGHEKLASNTVKIGIDKTQLVTRFLTEIMIHFIGIFT